MKSTGERNDEGGGGQVVMSTPMRRLRFSRFGLAEDPTHAHVVMPDGTLREVYGIYRRESPQAIMLKVRSFNREILEEVAASAVHILDRTWEGK
jgi:hypothetical protein